jgi:hypothetical protein
MSEEKEFTITKFSSGVNLAQAIENAVKAANKRVQENHETSLYQLVNDILKEGETMGEQQEAAHYRNTPEQPEDDL